MCRSSLKQQTKLGSCANKRGKPISRQILLKWESRNVSREKNDLKFIEYNIKY